MKKVIIITENLYGGGVERILQIICSHLDLEKYELTIYTMKKEKPSKAYFPDKIQFKYIYDTIEGNTKTVSKLWIKIKNKIKLLFYYNTSPVTFYHLFINERADVALAFIEGYATRLVSGFPSNVKKIAWLHIELRNYHWSKIAFRNDSEEEKAYLSMDCIPCVSIEVKRQLCDLYPRVKNSIVLHNPVDKSMIIRKANEKLPSSLKIGKAKTLISIGTLNERKGHLRLLKVLQRIIKGGADIQLWILGRGDLRDELLSYIKKNQLTDNVILLGYQENPYNYLAAADIYICSSFAEGYNTAITEALVLGKAVVSTECSGVKEQLGENDEWGICTPNSEEGLYEGIKQMLNEDTFRHYTNQASIRGNCFTLENSINRISELLDN